MISDELSVMMTTTTMSCYNVHCVITEVLHVCAQKAHRLSTHSRDLPALQGEVDIFSVDAEPMPSGPYDTHAPQISESAVHP